MKAHALVLRSGFHHSLAPPLRAAEFHLCQHLRLFGLQRGSLAGWSAQPGPLCSHSAPALPKSLGNKEVKRKEGKGIILKCKSDSRTHPFKHKQLTYISCTTDIVHSHELAVHCIHDSMHFFVPLPHKQLALFFPDRRGYVIS